MTSRLFQKLREKKGLAYVFIPSYHHTQTVAYLESMLALALIVSIISYHLLKLNSKSY